jgi:biopolymer transport protein ExbD
MRTIKLKPKDAEIPLSSLPDIVFLLLIFFLVTTTIDAEKGIGLTLPSANPQPVVVPPDQLAKILINASGQILVDNEIVSLQNLSKVIKTRLIEKPKLIASVLTDRNTSYDVYIKVLDKLKQAWGNQPAVISIAEPVSN